VVAGLLLLLSAETEAQDPRAPAVQGPLLIVRTGGDEDVVREIEAELGAGTWRIVQIGPDEQLERTALRDLARAQAALAAIRVDLERGELELWVAGARPGTDGSSDLIATSDSSANVVALRVVETLRARLLVAAQAQETAPAPVAQDEHADAAPAQRPTATASPAEPANAAAEAERARRQAEEPPADGASSRSYPGLSLELGPALTYSPGGLEPAIDGWLALRLQLARAWSAAAFALLPVWSERLRDSAGTSSVSTLLLGAGACLDITRTWFELGLSLGVGGVVSFTSGDAQPPYEARDDRAFATAAFVGPSVSLPLGAGFHAFARAIIGATLPRLAIRFANRDVARWGAPFISASLGIELALTR
jgi:hypothetical protein